MKDKTSTSSQTANDGNVPVISRFLVVYDNKDKKFYGMETVWSNEDVEGVKIYEGGQRWKIYSEHNTKEEALNEATLKNGL